MIPFYDTSFFKYKNYFQGFFLPYDYSLDITTLQQQQSQDPVLRTVYSWIVKNEKLETLTPLITGTPFLHAFYKRFSQLFIDDSTNLISLYNKHPTTLNQSSTPDFVRATIRICLPFRLSKTVFTKLHEHSHTGIKITYNTFAQYYYIPFVEKWLSIFIHDCIECHRNKHFNMKIQTAPTQSFSQHAPSFNYRISMDTKGPINPPSHNKSYIHVIIDAPTTPSKRPKSYVSETSSSSLLYRPPKTEIPITTRTQQTPVNTPMVHIPNTETVEQYVNYKHPTAIKTVRLQPQLKVVHIPDAEYTKLPPLKLPSELSNTPSKLYPPLKLFGNLLHHYQTS